MLARYFLYKTSLFCEVLYFILYDLPIIYCYKIYYCIKLKTSAERCPVPSSIRTNARLFV